MWGKSKKERINSDSSVLGLGILEDGGRLGEEHIRVSIHILRIPDSQESESGPKCDIRWFS